MALNIPMPGSTGAGFLQGIDTGSNLWSRIMQPTVQREQLQQQQNQFMQDLALKKQEQDRAQALLPFMIQQYKDQHTTATDTSKKNELYLNLINNALNPTPSNGTTPNITTQTPINNTMGDATQASTVNLVSSPIPAQMGAPTDSTGNLAPSQTAAIAPQNTGSSEHELRAGNPRLLQLDQLGGFVPGIPKPTQKITNGMIFTTYPSGRVTAQKVDGMQSPGAMTVTAKEASKIRDSATSLINTSNLVQQAYDLLDNNPDLTGPGNNFRFIHVPFTGMDFNLSNNKELGEFNEVTRKMQVEMAKYAASKGGIQAIKWVGGSKPSVTNPQEYNYGMLDGIQKNIENDYNTLNAQYKSQTGQDLPVPLPNMGSKRKKQNSEISNNGGAKTDFIRVNGKLVRAT